MPTKKILVVGGAGYIGSHMVLCLQEAGYTPVVFDNLSTGHRDAVMNAELVRGDLSDLYAVEDVFATNDFLAVMHFASFIQVGESVQHPAKYYQNNLAATLNLLNTMLKAKVKHFIFSSTAAVYGEPCYTPIDEKHPVSPVNPYGHSKAMVEQILADYSRAYDFCYSTLRYFNAAGADPHGRLHERHDPETHLIPLILQAANGDRAGITVYGRDYPTIDGTCVRDYIHVSDICDAHLLALSQLTETNTNAIYNLGNGQGYSVQQVIDAARTVTRSRVNVIEGNRRDGDPAVLVADSSLARTKLGWTPKYPDLTSIIAHAWLAFSRAESVKDWGPVKV